MNTAKIILKNIQHGNILYLVGHLVGNLFFWGFFQVLLLLHITAIIMSRQAFACPVIPLIKMTQYFKLTTNENIFSDLKIHITLVTSEIFMWLIYWALASWWIVPPRTGRWTWAEHGWCGMAAQSSVIKIWPREILQESISYKAFVYRHVPLWVINLLVILWNIIPSIYYCHFFPRGFMQL